MWDKLNKLSAQLSIAFMVILFGFIFLFTLLFVKVPEANKDLVHTLIGVVLGGTLVPAVGFLYTTNKRVRTMDDDYPVGPPRKPVDSDKTQ